MSAAEPLPTFAALHEIRDKAILLSLGRAFLCEEVFLRKVGHSIDESLENLREDILSLKMRFIGKFVEDVDTDNILDELHSQAAVLQTPDRRVTDKCTVGTLGAELEETVQALTEAIRTIRGKVEGEVEEYTAKEAVVKGAKTAGSFVSSLVSLVVKLVVLLFLLALGPAIYLGVTMDREGSLQNQITESKAYIQSQKTEIASLRKERDQLAARIKSSEGDDLTREQKLDIMEFNVKAHGLDERIHRAEADITEQERIIKLNQQKIERIKGKTFLQRYLRR
jgi:cell division protein FtsB